jgi:hypothetical protein
MEANVHSSRPGFLIAKPEEGGGRNLEISTESIDDTNDLHENSKALQDMLVYIVENIDLVAKPEEGGGRNLKISTECTDDTEDLIENSKALQDMLVYIVENIDFDCKLSGSSATCFARYPESELVDVCEAEGGLPVTLPDFTISCDGTAQGVKFKTTISYYDVLDCVALSCDTEDFGLEDILPELVAELKRELGTSDVNCHEDGGAIAGTVIASVVGVALLLAILIF